ncbi:MAG: tetratricopeptide repeat protein, partial [Pseudomonadota bacterium]|nr:tetratricopeptide repeat protein [Pseudomonadota bacterium]
MRRRLHLVVLVFLWLPIAGCADLPGRNDAFALSMAAAKQLSTGDSKDRPAGGADGVEREPETGLTPDLVYAVLVGQIAAERGNHRMAFTHFLEGARLARDPELAELATRSALLLDEADAVQQAIDAWLELEPDSLGAHQIAAYVRLDADDVEGALAHLRKLIALAAEDGSDGFMRAARLVSKLRPPERRLELMETLTADEPENADAWFARAIVAAGAERYDEAAEAARQASELRPGWNEPRIFLVQLLLTRGDREQARETLEVFVAENPQDQGLRLLYAQFLVEEKEFSHARDLFEYMLLDTPKEPDVLFALGVLSLQLEDLAAARDYFTRLRDTGQRQDDSAYYLGQVEEFAENLESAVSWYTKVDGEHALDARVRIARVRADQGEVERAREILQQLRDQWSDDAVTLYLIEAELLRDIDLQREAMAVYDEAVDAFPDDPDLLYARALLAAGMNRLEILERDLKAIIERDPHHAEALNALGYTLADQTDRFDEALAFIERAFSLKPEDPAVLDSMGWVQYRLGNNEKALGYLREALGSLP